MLLHEEILDLTNTNISFMIEEPLNTADTFSDINDICDKYLQILSIRKTNIVCTEVFENLKSLILGITNVAFRLTSVIKTTTFNLLSSKHFKRSELRDYLLNNSTLNNILNKVTFEDIHDVLVPVPSGLVVTYKEVIEKLNTLLNVINIENNLQRYIAIVEDLSNSVLLEKIDKNKLQRERSTLEQEYKIILQHRAAIDNCFTTKREIMKANKPFYECFSSMGEFITVRDQIYAFEKNFMCIHNASKLIENIETTIEKMVDHIVDKKNIEKPCLENIIIIIKSLATMFETYAYGIEDAHRIEHNYVNVLIALKTFLKK